MTKFVLLYSGGSMPETEAEQAEVLKAWGAWYESLGSAVVDPGNPISVAKKIDVKGDVSDGPVGVMMTGYTILNAESLDEAVEMAKTCPVLQGGSEISVFETFEIM
jgi:hypothetical protein